MPKPSPRNYHPQDNGADCANCPLRCKDMLPVPPYVATNPVFSIIAESPDAQSKYAGLPLQGNAAQKLTADLTALGAPTGAYNVFYRIACYAPPNKRTDSTLGKAAKACRARLLGELSQRTDPKTPRLYLGKRAPQGIVPSSPEHNSAVEIKLTRNVYRRRAMVLTHPKNAYFHAPAGRAQFREDLRRFVAAATGKLQWPTWDSITPGGMYLEASHEALAAINNLGPVVVADIETLGTDPLVDPITAIGLSDGRTAVSLNWASYSNKYGYYQGIEDSHGDLASQLRAALKKCLESRVVVGQNLGFDLLAFRQRLGIEITRTEDTLDGAKICDPELPAGLEELGARYLLLPSRWKSEFRAGRDDDAKGASEFAESRLEDLLRYNARDALITAQIWFEIEKNLAEED